MKFFMFLFIFSSTAFGTTWTHITSVRLNPGPSDLRSPPLPVITPTIGNKVLILMPRTCGVVSLTNLSFLENGTALPATFEQEVSNTNQVEWVYKLTNGPAMLSHIGFNVSLDYECFIDFYTVKAEAPAPSAPLDKHCRKVAFNLSYDYEGHYEQIAAMAGEPCFVFIRFRTLAEYRYFLDDRREKNKSPDFEVLQPENVKVEFEAKVGNSG